MLINLLDKAYNSRNKLSETFPHQLLEQDGTTLGHDVTFDLSPKDHVTDQIIVPKGRTVVLKGLIIVGCHLSS